MTPLEFSRIVRDQTPLATPRQLRFESALRHDVGVRSMFRDVKLYSLLKKEFATSSMA